MNGIHGGDIYRNRVILDFSVNINPLGIPKAVTVALHNAAESCSTYPDIEAEKLRRAVSGMLSVPEDMLLFGNGASELFMAAVHALRPAKTVIPVPSFSGYEYAARAAGSEIIYYPMKEEKNFLPEKELLEALTEDVDLLFLGNPNNPTGALMTREYLEAALEHCRQRKIHVILDECFMGFCRKSSGGRTSSMISDISAYDNLILIRAFTKSFSIPGVRLGYLVCSNPELYHRIRRQLPEWNVSVFAQAAGIACAGELEFLEKTVSYIREERNLLEEGLKKLGFRVYPGEANFLLIREENSLVCTERPRLCHVKPLDEKLLEHGILIRSCENFRGLGTGYYRIAVKRREENEILLKTMGEL